MRNRSSSSFLSGVVEGNGIPVYEGRSPAGRWRVGASPVVRVAGAPVSALAGLRCARSFAQITRLVALDSWLAAEGAALSGALHAVIGELGDPAARPGLVGLRRAVHQARMPGVREWNPSLAAVLPGDLALVVETWVDRCAERDRWRAELPEVLAGEKADAQARLRQELRRPEFRRALSQAAPTLLADAEKWLADERRRPKPQKVLRLAKYLSRAAAKTSPYSTFMSAGLGGWSRRHGPAVVFHPPQEPLGVLELDGAYLKAVRTALTRHPELAWATRVRVNPSASEAGGKLRFLTAPPAESLIAVELVPAVRECLRLVGDEGQSTLAQLREGLRAAVGASGAPGVDRFVDQLLAAGLLQASIPVPEHSTDVLGELGQWVDTHSGPRLAEVSALLGRVRTELRRDVPVSDVDDHRARQDALRQAMGELAGELGVDQASVRGWSRDAFHETAVVGAPVAECSLEQWRPALGDLDVIRRFLTIFDPDRPIRLALGSYFRERFGSGAHVSLLSLYQAVQEELARTEDTHPGAAAADLRVLLGPKALPWSPVVLGRAAAGPAADAGQAARPRPGRPSLGQPGSRRGGAGGSRRCWPSRSPSWPEWVTPPRSVGCYVQARWSGRGLRLVLNDAHGGHGRGRSRLRHLMARTGGDVESGEPQWRSPRPGPVLAELSGLLSWTLNVRMPGVPYEIDYPFTVSGRPASERIPLGDLVVTHNPETDLVGLYSARLDTEVVPLHLGMLAEFMLPPVARFLVRAFGASGLMHVSMPPLIPTENWLRPSAPGRPAEIARYPRVEMGRVVVQRARWSIPATLVPGRSAGERDADYLLRLVAWLRREAIPDRVFVRAWTEGMSNEKLKARKPVYLDFANPWLVADFERQVSASQSVIFEEALPDPGEALGPHQDQVTEFLVEISDGEAEHG